MLSISNCFTRLPGETRFGMPEQEYQSRIVSAAEKCGKKAAGSIQKWIEISSAAVVN
jgi:hypothetical protein